MWLIPQWKIYLFDALFVNDLILFGCGWHQYQGNVDLYTRLLYRSILSNDWFHSVRDGYTKAKLESIGITNVINTGCPSLWNMSPEHCASIPREKAENVVCTLTIYNPRQSLDLELIKTLRRHYRKVYFWVQTLGDYEYSKRLDPGLEYIEPSLAGLDKLLHSSEDIDYVGTRLHAGIRALQAKRRAIIVEIDNRAAEMGRDYGLVTVARDDFEKLNGLITSIFDTKITLNHESINKWKSQFLDPAQA